MFGHFQVHDHLEDGRTECHRASFSDIRAVNLKEPKQKLS